MTSTINAGGPLRCVVAGILCFFTAAVAQSQAPAVAPNEVVARPLSYDVASIRPAGPSPSHIGVQTKPDETDAIQTLRGLVGYAYGVRPEFVFEGPKWGANDLFEIKAKVDESDVPSLERMSYLDRAYMLRPVLESRFGLKMHRETRVLRVFDLVVAKGGLGPKFIPHSSSKPVNGIALAGENFSGNGVELPFFTRILSNALLATIGRPVIDKTGLSGEYDFDLRWNAGVAANADGATANLRPDIFTAIQEQLGLKLQPNQEPVETIIIDSASKPTEN